VPFLTDTSVGTLELVVQDATNLIEPEGLAFDAFGNLFVTREETGSSGGVSYVNKTGTITNLVSGISRADGIILLPNGDLLVVSEVSPASTTNRLYRLKVNYGANNIPTSASATSLTTTVAINNPEGIDVLASSGAFGTAGTVFVSEDANPGRIFRVNLDTGAANVFVDFSEKLSRPEGLAFGDFNGALAPALYTPEAGANRIRKIESNGTTNVFGNPTVVNLTFPDGLKFGPDGFLYVAEDSEFGGEIGRIIRIAANGTHTVFAGGFADPSALAFDPTNGDLYIADQGSSSIWRVEFAGVNRAPTANIGGPYSGTEDTAITFDGSGSSDPNGDPLTYTWNFGDGTIVSQASATIGHTYLWGDAFTVTLTVSDGNGGTATAATSVPVTERNDIPVANAGGPYGGAARKAVTFNGSKSFDPDNTDGTSINDQPLYYKWNFGDGTTTVTSNAVATHTYNAQGTYAVTLMVSDGTNDSVPATTTATIKKAGGKAKTATALK
jgi:sugar lactone lactonase YvrE